MREIKVRNNGLFRRRPMNDAYGMYWLAHVIVGMQAADADVPIYGSLEPRGTCALPPPRPLSPQWFVSWSTALIPLIHLSIHSR